MIIFNNVNKTFNQNKQSISALVDINLHIKAGDVFGVIGYSGAGKSTLIRLINRLENISSGELIVNHQNLKILTAEQLRQQQKQIGMIFQQFNLLQNKTVFENIALPLILNNSSKVIINHRVNELLEYVELTDKANAYPSELSGGQKQRVGIARSLATEPKILLCDEATSALDPQTTASILQLLSKINQEQHITIVVVTHEMEVIQSICHNVAVMEKGQIIEQGKTLEIFANPQHPTTKTFINTVLTEHLPNKIFRNLVSTNHLPVYRLEFLGKSAQTPVINELILQNKVKVNILYANMAPIENEVLGGMFVQLDGPASEVKQALTYLTSQGVRVNIGRKENV